MRLCRLNNKLAGFRWIERRLGKRLECDPVQISLPLPLQRETAPQMLGTHHILQHRIIVLAEAEYNERLPEYRVLRVEGKDLQRQVRPVSIVDQTLKLLIHHQFVT